MPECTLTSHQLIARISNMGAELQSLRTHDGHELIWQADPKVWPRHAPILFPIVGRLKGDLLKHQGVPYPMGQHGFARDTNFQLINETEQSCTFRLTDDDNTRAHYPFAFDLRVTYTLLENSLKVTYLLSNPAETTLYASIGGHPAFIWPLDPAVAKEKHQIKFEQSEAAPIRRLQGGLMQDTPLPSPVSAKTLVLTDELFEADAIIFDQLVSRRVSYIASDRRRITLAFDDFPHLGIWSKPGADFICIEPWQGHASSETFDGEFQDKPGMVALGSGQQRQWHYTISVNT